MARTWIISDTHFGHGGMLRMTDSNGNRFRPFDSVEELDELMIENWNKKVNAKDRVYHLGDIAINRRYIEKLAHVNGRLVLIRGNHDIFKITDYLPYFDDVRSYKMMPGCGVIMSHIPVHPQSLEHRFKYNIHGHLHANVVGDSKYLNVCVEHTNWGPIDFEEALFLAKEQEGGSNE